MSSKNKKINNNPTNSEIENFILNSKSFSLLVLFKFSFNFIGLMSYSKVEVDPKRYGIESKIFIS